PDRWESVLQEALHSVRSLLCTATNESPHERMFRHPRRTSNGESLPSWLLYPGKVLMKRQVRSSKYDPLVDEVDLLEADRNHALVRLQNGREVSVSLKHLAPRGDICIGDNVEEDFQDVPPLRQSDTLLQKRIPEEEEKEENEGEHEADDKHENRTLPRKSTSSEAEKPVYNCALILEKTISFLSFFEFSFKLWECDDNMENHGKGFEGCYVRNGLLNGTTRASKPAGAPASHDRSGSIRCRRFITYGYEQIILNLIVLGLPVRIQNELSRSSVGSIRLLISKLKKFDHDSSSRRFGSMERVENRDQTPKTFETSGKLQKAPASEEKHPCPICEKGKRGTRYHPESKYVSMVPDACQVQRDLERDRKKAFENSQKVHERNKRRIDKHRKTPTFEVGNMVYVNHGNSLNRNKLAEIRTGPFKILEKTSQTIYKIDSGYRKTESNYFHVSKLYPYSKE
ncbi:unnamed protein product, partial [Nesidiocoris tenuis]